MDLEECRRESEEPEMELDDFEFRLIRKFLGQNPRVIYKKKWTKFIVNILMNRVHRPISPGSELNHLTVLDISSTAQTHIPAAIGSALRLQELNVSHNRLGKEENADGHWDWLFGPKIVKSLEILDLSLNELVELPECMWKLRRLTKLALEGNRLVTLPRKLNSSMTLQYLSVQNNDLIQLPDNVFRCPLEYFDIAGNPDLHRNILRDLMQPDFSIYPIWHYSMQPRSLFDIADRSIFNNKIDYSGLPESLVDQLDEAVRCYCGFHARDESQYQVLDCLLYWRSFPVNIRSNRRRYTLYVECAVCSIECRNRLSWRVNAQYRQIWYQPPTRLT